MHVVLKSTDPDFFSLKKLRPLPLDNIFVLQIFPRLQNCKFYESKILLLYVRAWWMKTNVPENIYIQGRSQKKKNL
jgi:hypothetical protein